MRDTSRRTSIGTAWIPGRHSYGCRTVCSRARVRAFLLAMFVLTGCAIATTGCRYDRIVLAPADTVHDITIPFPSP